MDSSSFLNILNEDEDKDFKNKYCSIEGLDNFSNAVSGNKRKSLAVNYSSVMEQSSTVAMLAKCIDRESPSDSTSESKEDIKEAKYRRPVQAAPKPSDLPSTSKDTSLRALRENGKPFSESEVKYCDICQDHQLRWFMIDFEREILMCAKENCPKNASLDELPVRENSNIIDLRKSRATLLATKFIANEKTVSYREICRLTNLLDGMENPKDMQFQCPIIQDGHVPTSMRKPPRLDQQKLLDERFNLENMLKQSILRFQDTVKSEPSLLSILQLGMIKPFSQPSAVPNANPNE